LTGRIANNSTDPHCPAPPRPAANAPGGEARRPETPTDQLRVSTSASQAHAVSPDGLSPEELTLVREGLLPPDFAHLMAAENNPDLPDAQKQALFQGAFKDGPFARDYGAPFKLLAGARLMHDKPELARLFKDLRPGDVLMIAPDKDKGVVAGLTGGPFTHTMICVSTTPYPQFIEAIGITAGKDDPTSNRVRRTTIFNELKPDTTFRVLRPAQGSDGKLNQQAVRQAIDYATQQLGKPYNWAFGQRSDSQDRTETPKAFYCSQLVYDAYAQGAGVDFPIEKDGQRERTLVAANSLLDALGPKDKAQLRTTLSNLIDSRPDAAQWVRAMVYDVLPSCQATQALVATPAKQAQLAAFLAAAVDPHQPPAKGLWGKLKLAWNAHAAGGIGFGAAIATAWRLARACGPHAPQIIHALSHPSFQDRRLDFATRRPEQGAPVLGDFVSPTDVARAKVPGRDYNRRPGLVMEDMAVAHGMTLLFDAYNDRA
jgi:hypothetical protein